MKAISLVVAVAALAIFASLDVAHAGFHATSQLRDKVGCPAQERVVRRMQRHPERWGKAVASIVAQYPGGSKR
jgi:hypothetical protein